MATDEQELLTGRPVGVSSQKIASHDEAAFAEALLAALRQAFRGLRAPAANPTMEPPGRTVSHHQCEG
ncbi:MAG: hypothetical protein WAL84_02735 [Candidatus Dormiibacterota bacterium]